MSSIYARGGQLWARIKGLKAPGQWGSVATGYLVGQERQAQRYADEAQNQIDKKLAEGAAASGPLTIATYAATWLMEREALGVRTVGDDEARLRLHVLPCLGTLRLDEVRPIHIRDLIRDLRKSAKIASKPMAPKSIRHIYGMLHSLFENAVGDEILATNPCKLKRGELPKKVDADPEWRALATYTVHEVEQLFSDSRLPVERRVQYALKSLAGLRHGEVAALCWRHYDPAREPLGALTIAFSYDSKHKVVKPTKMEDTRAVPVHPVLAKILAAWKLSHWERIYGRRPGPDDLIVPTRNGTHVNAGEAGKAMKLDLAALGLRVDAGRLRDRGGHDLRAWFITTAKEHGASPDLLQRVTHKAGTDVQSLYTRPLWSALCAEVAKLKCAILGGEVLELATVLATVEVMARNRWRKVATPTGFESLLPSNSVYEKPPEPKNNANLANSREPDSTETVARLATVLAQAVLAGDTALAQRLAQAIQARDQGATERRPRPDLKVVP